MTEQNKNNILSGILVFALIVWAMLAIAATSYILNNGSWFLGVMNILLHICGLVGYYFQCVKPVTTKKPE